MKKLPLLTKPTVSIRDPPQQPAQPNFKIRVPCQLPLPAKPAEPIIQIRVPPQLPVIQRMQMDVPNENTTKTTLQLPPPPALLLFTFQTINTWLLSTWTLKPDQKYLLNLNISRLRDAPLYIWNLPAGVRIRESIKPDREEFIKSLYVATDASQTTAASHIFIGKIDTWIMKLRTYGKTCSCLVEKSRKASELLIKHRAANLTYRAALKRFGRDPCMDNMPAVHAALKELYVLKHIE